MGNMRASHPPSLRIFFTTEMWERYGFYVVQTLLALFLSLHFKWDDKAVYALVGSFTALTYVSPVIGGWIADYLIGQKRAILAGAVILLFAYIALMTLALGGSSTLGLTASLAGIAVGTGLLKPNISSLLGNEYPEDSPLRDAGFTFFYMGITSGIILGSTVPGVLNYHFGWPISFMSAAFGMVIAIAIFSFGCHRYKIADYSTYQYEFKNLVLAGFIMTCMWILWHRKKKMKAVKQSGDYANKFVYAMCFMTLGYLIISAVCHYNTGLALISPLLIIPAYLVFSLAELYLYPVGLSAITVLASRKKVSTMMGIFLVSLGIGGFLSGKLAYLTAIPTGETSAIIINAHYALAFNKLLFILLGATLLCIGINFLIHYLLKGDRVNLT